MRPVLFFTILIAGLSCSPGGGPSFVHQEKISPQDFQNAQTLSAALIENSFPISPFEEELPEVSACTPAEFQCQLLPSGNLLISFTDGEWNYGTRYELLLKPEDGHWDLLAVAGQSYSDMGRARVKGIPLQPEWKSGMRAHFEWVNPVSQDGKQLMLQLYTSRSFFFRGRKDTFLGKVDTHPWPIPSVPLQRKLDWAAPR